MTTRTIVITGASDGIGTAAARRLKSRGEHVVLVGRDPGKTEAVARELDAPFHVADYAELDQVRRLAAELYDYPRIDVLANNAGGIMGARTLTVDGFEKTFQVNHLGGFLLTHLLLPKLVSSQAHVIQTSSQAARAFSAFSLDDLQNERDYSPHQAYGNGKLANILFTRELHRRYATHGLAAAAFHPGVVGTNFANDTGTFLRFVYHTPIVKNLVTISPDKGAEQLVWLAKGAPGTDWEPGVYYEKKRPARSSRQADGAALATRLWEESARMVGVDPEGPSGL
ncbi:SDR family NAD(P)-dependent oxidoreductase [Nocardioides jishulii]|uniref:SDR family NAD(P)-dependent oxidoreductase n=1 Tax=Nocardioides jishulii TaxID=2575440 RepID=A0A4U2YJS5_9ACTN|nr:SDR family NAD(P)-dependent oxidoreductase [Nocardioides jishulii]QCX26886.1 SDR family NAD(P)-dependent oxidoreductase [Nocardioides jishulii]TKI61369.1 SDR family NAD(P)-dependent oxidoreductase [Nocardioides jishulii]